MNNIYVEIKEKCCSQCYAECDSCWLEELINKELSEERKKVVQEIKNEIKKLKKSAPKHDIGYDCDDVLLSYLEISEILDQIERGE